MKEITAEFKENELLVKFRSDVSEDKKNYIHSKVGSHKIKEFRTLRIDHVNLKKGMTVEEAIVSYEADPYVEYAEPNYKFTSQDFPNDSLFSQLWGLYNTGQTGGTAGADIDAPNAWNITTGRDDVVVVVIDTGVDYTHQDLAANMWINTREIPGNGIDDDGDGYTDDVYGINVLTNSGDPFDDFGHGTHVSGTIGALGNNSIGVVGVNWNINIMGCKFLDATGSGYTDGAIVCLEYVRVMRARGENIIATSNSWGGGGYSQALYDAINGQQDVLFIAAAGNSHVNNDQGTFYPACYYLPNLIAVAATDHNDSIASFSNYGRRSVSVGGPGVNILSALPAINAFGISGGYGNLSGTSMATPHVSGLAALIKSQDMAKDWKAIRNLILSGGDSITSMDKITITGKRINAFGSLSCVNSPLFSALKYPSSFDTGAPAVLSALSINCANSVGPVTVTSSSGETIELHDDGITPDLAAGDGIFSATWTPSNYSSYLIFSSPAGTEKIDNPLIIITNSLPAGSVYSPYSQTLEANGGAPPYTWAILSGNLPTGLTLDSAGGEIHGTPAAAGTYNFIIQVTDDESTSVSKSLSIRVSGPLSDLVMTSVSGPASANVGQQVSITSTVKNQGPGDAAAFKVGIYISTDSTVTTSDTFLGFSSVTSLAKGVEQTLITVATIPANLTTGSYYIGAIADYAKSVIETDESNNAFVGNQVSITVLPPDLVVTLVSGPSSGGAGQQITTAVTIMNRGAGNAGGCYLAVYLSPSATITTSNTRLGTVAVSGLASGAQRTVNITGTIPVNFTQGTYYIGAIADYSNLIRESDETNNALAGNRITVSVADLVVTSLSGPSSGGAGQQITAAVTIMNRGAGNAGGSYLAVYLSPSATITTSNTRLGTVAVSGLASGAQRTVNITGTIPVNFTQGTYYIGAIADYSNLLRESDETNNALAGNRITVSVADLVVTLVSGPSSGGAGQQITTAVTIMNRGAGNAGGCYLAVYLSPSATITTSNTRLGTVAVSGLASGAQRTVNITGTIPVNFTQGTYYIGAIADYSNLLRESDETNNALAGNRIAVYVADLVVTLVSGPSSGGAGRQITTAVTIMNRGAGNAGGCYLAVYLSPSATITTSNTRLGTVAVSGLASGAQRTVNITGTIPVNFTQGTYYIGAIADYSNLLRESDETNNALAGNRIVLTQ